MNERALQDKINEMLLWAQYGEVFKIEMPDGTVQLYTRATGPTDIAYIGDNGVTIPLEPWTGATLEG